VRRLVPLIALVLASCAQAAADQGGTWRRQVAARSHLSFELSPGWRLIELRTGGVGATSFEPPPGWFADSSRPRRLPRGGAVVLVYPSQGVRFPAVHRRLRLADGISGYYESHLRLRGTMFRFTRAERSLQIAVAFAGRRGETMDVLNGIWPWPAHPRVVWHRSRSVGSPSAGRLTGGVQFPEHGLRFFTWDPLLKGQPDRPGRRWGNARLVRLLLRVVREYARDNPGAPRLGVGDLSRPGGGWFGPRHVSHQNGLDADIFFPRLDRRERPPDRPNQIDRRLAQDLVDRFERAGAVRVFVGPHTGLRGDPRIVQTLAGHDNHLHVRIRG
jgi:penicillin-insensitive murein endopeptidase